MRAFLFHASTATTAALLCVATYLVLFVAPVEEVMGLAQKIFYLHVPSAMAMYAGVVMCTVSSLLFLIRKTKLWDAAGRVGASLGATFCLVVLITGPIWASQAWGAPWVWDPRLTSVAVLGLILASYHLVRIIGQENSAARRLAAALGVLAAPNGILIHMAVQMWGGQHPTVIYESGGLDPTMRMIFYVCIAGALALFLVLAWWQLDLALLRQRTEELEVRALLVESARR